ncbi:MAG: LamG-like jellyroll fold domain-containing protein [Verrucomicrobiota bacterium]
MTIRTTLIILVFCALVSIAQAASVFGPFNAIASGSGPGHVEWFDGVPPTEPEAPWTISAWVKPSAAITTPTLVAGFGDGVDYIGAQRYLCADAKGWFFWYGGLSAKKHELITVPDRLETQAPVSAGKWQHVAATYDGKNLCLYVDGKEVGKAEIKLSRAAMQPMVAPPPVWKDGTSFSGKVAAFTILGSALPGTEIAQLAKSVKDLDASAFAPAPEGPTPGNHSDAKQFTDGERNPKTQPPDMLPKPVPPVESKRAPKLSVRAVPLPQADGKLILNRGWEMVEASTVAALPEKISSPGFDTHSWYDATVPGTALTTLVQQGIYPEPTHGLNNMLIPDMATKSWWYRVEFPTDEAWKNRHVELLFKGINYHAEAWLNGRPLGNLTGAFIRGRFDIAPLLATTGNNVLAVRVWPQPHYTQGLGEASVKFGPGSNGSDGMLDGPTFFCTEGWDWIPTIRDRCTGIWQDVVISPSGPVTVADPQIVTKLPKLPDLSVAEVTLKADVRNVTAQPQTAKVEAELSGIRLAKTISLAPNETATVTFAPSEFPQLAIHNPKLWWPNGYGEPVLHDLTFRVLDASGTESNRLSARVGLRQLDYDYLPKKDKPDVHDGPFYIKVNGCRIFVRGGNWGLDEALKRSSTARLEPAFRLEREAGLNMIRNWTGQNTQENFYALADQYGLLVWNDFWLSTENCNFPAIDAERFMANADDTIKRFRHHPSIAVWCGRNEGTPPEWLNTPLGESYQKLDGTRIYIPSSRGGKLMGTGPWTYKDPKWYYVTHSKGFCTELGINSIPTVDALKAMLDPSQYWPWQDNDAWAYHDFPSKSHGDVVPFRDEAEKRYGAGTDLEGFVKRMQMQNYTHHRVLLESFNSKMWQATTGVMLWMSHPAWPSMVWQLYTSDFDPNASFFGAKKACEPVHVQWDLVDDAVSVVNTTYDAFPEAKIKVVVYGLDATVLKSSEKSFDLAPSSLLKPANVEWADFATHPVQFVKLELRDKTDKLLSENFYWQSDPEKPEELRALETLPQVKLQGKVTAARDRDETVTTVELANPTKNVALMTHLVLRNAADGTRILPAYASDNYVTLLPGEKKTITIRCANKDVPQAMAVTLDGWNITPTTLSFAK